MKKNKAFTLIELIISLAIVSILVIIINAMFVFNFKIYRSAHEKDQSYKQAANAMLFIENVVRESEKFEKIDDPKCNFVASLGNSKYQFYLDEKNQKLKTKINGSKGEGNNWIGQINDMMLTYDGNEKVFIWIEGLDGEVYQTTVNIGIRK